MNAFDIIGPVMVGPSSSHTAGAVRIGNMVRALLGEEPVDIVIRLYGSFARTYRGHGTDRALIGGLIGLSADDPGIRESLDTASVKNIKFRFEACEQADLHPNTVYIEATGQSGKKASIVGCSVGGGNILIKKINGIDVELDGQYYTLAIPHKDAPGTVAGVTNLLAKSGINIARMNVFRSHRRGNAMMIIETDQYMEAELINEIGKLPDIQEVTAIAPLK